MSVEETKSNTLTELLDQIGFVQCVKIGAVLQIQIETIKEKVTHTAASEKRKYLSIIAWSNHYLKKLPDIKRELEAKKPRSRENLDKWWKFASDWMIRVKQVIATGSFEIVKEIEKVNVDECVKQRMKILTQMDLILGKLSNLDKDNLQQKKEYLTLLGSSKYYVDQLDAFGETEVKESKSSEQMEDASGVVVSSKFMNQLTEWYLYAVDWVEHIDQLLQ